MLKLFADYLKCPPEFQPLDIYTRILVSRVKDQLILLISGMDFHTVEWGRNARESKAKPLYSERLRIYLSRTDRDDTTRTRDYRLRTRTSGTPNLICPARAPRSNGSSEIKSLQKFVQSIFSVSCKRVSVSNCILLAELEVYLHKEHVRTGSRKHLKRCYC